MLEVAFEANDHPRVRCLSTSSAGGRRLLRTRRRTRVVVCFERTRRRALVAASSSVRPYDPTLRVRPERAHVVTAGYIAPSPS